MAVKLYSQTKSNKYTHSLNLPDAARDNKPITLHCRKSVADHGYSRIYYPQLAQTHTVQTQLSRYLRSASDLQPAT